MAIRWYVLPIDESVSGYRGPKYLKWRMNPTGLDVRWGMMDYGLMPVCILWADVTQPQHNGLVANADCRLIVQHANVDNAVSNAAATVRTNLEALHIPGNWVQSTDTWRNVLRTTMGLFLFAQRLHGKFGAKALPDGYTLDTTWAELPTGARQLLLDTAQELGIDTSGATSAITLRQIFKTFGDAWGARPIYIGGIEL